MGEPFRSQQLFSFFFIFLTTCCFYRQLKERQIAALCSFKLEVQDLYTIWRRYFTFSYHPLDLSYVFVPTS